MMLFDRYRNKSKSTSLAPSTTEKKKLSIFRRIPIYLHKKKQKKTDELHRPRTSMSLPNIHTLAMPEKKPLPIPTHMNSKQRKRHSADQRRFRPRLPDNRHSITFGHLPALNKAMPDMSFSPEQLAKLNRLAHLPDTTDQLLARLDPKPVHLVPHRSISHQNLNAPQPQPHQTTPLEPEALARLIELDEVILIDVRNLIDYQRRRIRQSLNVNLPSLLIKRYQRGTIANFNLENFITTSEGRAIYQAQCKKGPDVPRTGTLLEQKAAEAELRHRRKKCWVVYDEEMQQDDQTSQAWTLLHVLDRFVQADRSHEGQVYYLQGGFQGFQARFEHLLETTSATFSLPDPPQMKLGNLPRRSISYTIGESKNKRTSLFTLDTQAARVNNANALARRAKRRQPEDTQMAMPATQLIRVTEDEETMTASPRTEQDFSFVISEIIPGFLFVGPEIETEEQAKALDERHIKRVLNMAEECHDEGLASRSIVYHKISARDTLEMKNIELVMMEAVCFIEEAKKHHEPIYVHCKAGKSRSITAILAYLVTSERWTLKRAYRHVIKARPNMSPNIGFISELMKMEGKVHGRVSSFMETDWQSTSLPSPEYANELFQLEKAWQIV